jgi:hypothetical protein
VPKLSSLILIAAIALVFVRQWLGLVFDSTVRRADPFVENGEPFKGHF